MYTHTAPAAQHHTDYICAIFSLELFCSCYPLELSMEWRKKKHTRKRINALLISVAGLFSYELYEYANAGAFITSHSTSNRFNQCLYHREMETCSEWTHWMLVSHFMEKKLTQPLTALSSYVCRFIFKIKIHDTFTRPNQYDEKSSQKAFHLWIIQLNRANG